MDEGSDSPMEITPEDPNPSKATKNVSFSPRGYQLEMLEASMKENIIVAVRFHSLLRESHADSRS